MRCSPNHLIPNETMTMTTTTTMNEREGAQAIILVQRMQQRRFRSRPEITSRTESGSLGYIDAATANEEALWQTPLAACVFCYRVFDLRILFAAGNRWIPGRQENSAICPHCSIDAIIPRWPHELLERRWYHQLKAWWRDGWAEIEYATIIDEEEEDEVQVETDTAIKHRCYCHHHHHIPAVSVILCVRNMFVRVVTCSDIAPANANNLIGRRTQNYVQLQQCIFTNHNCNRALSSTATAIDYKHKHKQQSHSAHSNNSV